MPVVVSNNPRAESSLFGLETANRELQDNGGEAIVKGEPSLNDVILAATQICYCSPTKLYNIAVSSPNAATYKGRVIEYAKGLLDKYQQLIKNKILEAGELTLSRTEPPSAQLDPMSRQHINMASKRYSTAYNTCIAGIKKYSDSGGDWEISTITIAANLSWYCGYAFPKITSLEDLLQVVESFCILPDGSRFPTPLELDEADLFIHIWSADHSTIASASSPKAETEASSTVIAGFISQATTYPLPRDWLEYPKPEDETDIEECLTRQPSPHTFRGNLQARLKRSPHDRGKLRDC